MGLTPPPSKKNPSWISRMRVKTLNHIDQLLDWSVSSSLKKYALAHPPHEQHIAFSTKELQEFSKFHGFFSSFHPLVGKVSHDPEDVDLVCHLFEVAFETIKEPAYLEFCIAELLTKVLAYRELKKGQVLLIPFVRAGKSSMQRFVVDRVFNLWNGMPAYGLKSEKEGVSSLLLFRGTDLSLDSQRGWASVMSDLDIKGPGLSAFRKSQTKLHDWLVSMQREKRSAKVMGFSLGGALSTYTFIYENEYLSLDPSYSFHPPGVSEDVLKDFEILSLREQSRLLTYVAEGDLVSKVGKLAGNVFALGLFKEMKPLTAHTIFISAECLFKERKVDVQKENNNR